MFRLGREQGKTKHYTRVNLEHPWDCASPLNCYKASAAAALQQSILWCATENAGQNRWDHLASSPRGSRDKSLHNLRFVKEQRDRKVSQKAVDYINNKVRVRWWCAANWQHASFWGRQCYVYTDSVEVCIRYTIVAWTHTHTSARAALRGPGLMVQYHMTGSKFLICESGLSLKIPAQLSRATYLNRVAGNGFGRPFPFPDGFHPNGGPNDWIFDQIMTAVSIKSDHERANYVTLIGKDDKETWWCSIKFLATKNRFLKPCI